MQLVQTVDADDERRGPSRYHNATRFRPGRNKTAVLIISLLISLSGLTLRGQDLTVRPDQASGVYAANQPITWTIGIRDGSPGDIHDARFRVLTGQLIETAHGSLDLTSGTATVSTRLADASTALLIVEATINGNKVRVLGGAIADPLKISPSALAPTDFHTFWNNQLRQLAAMPLNPQVEVRDSLRPSIDYALITLDSINGTRVYGELAVPAGGGKHPAMLILPAAGVYGLAKPLVTDAAASGWLTMAIMAHDAPLDRDEAFYKRLADTTLKDYPRIGETDREGSYFLRMYLGCVRAVDYLAQRPDWDGKMLVVRGESQGGQLALVTAALSHKVTGAFALVPAGCDQNGRLARRATGFPYYERAADASKNEKTSEIGRYFDVVNFMPRIKCPTLIGCGLLDETCPAAGVLAAFNQLNAPKELVILPWSNHRGDQNAHAEFNARMTDCYHAVLHGLPIPIPSGRPPATSRSE